MRHVATLVVGIALTGCSLIYNPSNLPPPIDAPPDPTMLQLGGAGPMMLFEGQGTGGSRPAILAITGKNLTVAATVRVYATGSETPMITVNSNDPMITSKVSAASDVLAVSVTLPVDPALPADATSAMQDIPLTIEVSQPAASGMVTKTLPGAVTLRTLPELVAGTSDSTSLQPMYSQVDLSGPLTFTAASGRKRALIRSASTINLKDVTVSASTAPGGPAGPGGLAGGTAGSITMAAGQGGGGASGGGAGTLLIGGGGAGFASAGSDGTDGGSGRISGGNPTGDPLISDYATNFSAGGGGGIGSVGGSGGGTIELTAAGDVHVGAITANGAPGGKGGTTAAGGGAGGIVVIRSGGTATLGGAINAVGGLGGTGGAGTAGAGSIGRTRIDAPVVSGTPVVTPSFHTGASWDPATPLTTKTSPFAMKLFGTVADKFDVVVLDGAGGASSPAFTADFGNASQITVRPTLQPGFNRVCVTRTGGSVTVVEATNCIDLAYVP
jgi:hypothetical protein